MANGRWRDEEERNKMMGKPPARRYTRDIPTPGSIAPDAKKKASLAPVREAIRRDWGHDAPGLMEAGGTAGTLTPRARTRGRSLGNYYRKRMKKERNQEDAQTMKETREMVLGHDTPGSTGQYRPEMESGADEAAFYTQWHDERGTPESETAAINQKLDSPQAPIGKTYTSPHPGDRPEAVSQPGSRTGHGTDRWTEGMTKSEQIYTKEGKPSFGTRQAAAATLRPRTVQRDGEERWQPRFTPGVRMSLEDQQTALNQRHQAAHQTEQEMMVTAREFYGVEMKMQLEKTRRIREDAAKLGKHDEESIYRYARSRPDLYGKVSWRDLDNPSQVAAELLEKTGDPDLMGLVQDYRNAADLVPMGTIRGTEHTWSVGLTGREYATLQEALTGVPEYVTPRENMMADMYGKELDYFGKIEQAQLGVLAAQIRKKTAAMEIADWKAEELPSGEKIWVRTDPNDPMGMPQVAMGLDKGLMDVSQGLADLWKTKDYKTLYALMRVQGPEGDKIRRGVHKYAPSIEEAALFEKWVAEQRKRAMLEAEKRKPKGGPKIETYKPKGQEDELPGI